MSSPVKTMFIRTLICLEITLFVSSALADYYDYRESSSKRFCGRYLTESLALICDGEYEAIVHAKKRSGNYIFTTNIQNNNFQHERFNAPTNKRTNER